MKAKMKMASITCFALIALSATSVLTLQAESATSSLVGYWKFDEGSGNVANDSSGKGNDGTIYGAAWTTGKIGNALSFTQDYVLVPDSPTLHITDSITVAAWVKVTGPTGTFKVVCARWYTPTGVLVHSFALEFVGLDKGISYPPLEDERQPWFRVINSTGRPDAAQDPGDSRALSDTMVAYGEWAHIAGTYDGVNVKMYVNGTLRGTMPLTGPISGGSAPLTIGAHPSSEMNWFKGVIDEVKIYDRALISDEIYNEYARTGYTPLWIQWWFWAIVALGIAAGGLAFTTVLYHQRASALKKP